ncbi:MAG: NAD(P)-binding protein [Thermodesulfobacteriota bacterium]
MKKALDYDYIIIGSGFGGAVAALRLSEKGYRVLVLEKGKWFSARDFPKTNWNLKKWLWMPFFRFFGAFQMTFLRHVTILSGVGVGGGSLVYANTMPIPKAGFFKAPSWAHLADWETELKDYFDLALKMRGERPSVPGWKPETWRYRSSPRRSARPTASTPRGSACTSARLMSPPRTRISTARGPSGPAVSSAAVA